MKKAFVESVACLLLALLLGGGALAEGSGYVVQMPGGAALVDAEGNDLAAMGTYSVLFELYGLPEGVHLYAGEAAGGAFGGYALIDAQGRALTDFSYQTIEYAEGVILFMQNERWGAMDLTGKILIEPKYTALMAVGEGRYLATRTDPYDDSPDVVCRIDADGTETATDIKITYGMYQAADGLYAAAAADSGLYGYLNAEGQWAVEPVYQWAGIFEDGRARAAHNGCFGLIDMQGNWVIEPRYESVYGGAQGEMICAGSGNQVSVIHPQTLEVIAQIEGQNVRGFMPELLASTKATYTQGFQAGESVLIIREGGALLIGGDGSRTELLTGALSIIRAGDGTDRLIVQMDKFGTGSVYLYGMDGARLAGPYQEILPLGEKDGRMHYLYMKFETVETRYPELDMSLLDEVPGTRICGLLSPDGEELFEAKAEYFTYMGEDRILIQQEGSAAMANFSGEIIRTFENPDAEDEST